MRYIATSVLVVTVTAGALSESPTHPARPVCLEGHSSVAREYTKSWAVFVGRVVAERNTVEGPHWDEGTTYRVAVEKVFSGSPGNEIEVFSENTSARFPMLVGTRYLLFVYRALERTLVDNCGNSMPLAQAQAVLDTLRQLSRDRRP